MSYEELKPKLKDAPDHIYYKLLLDNSQVIIEQCHLSSRGKVAKDLGMNPTVFATTYKFLFAIVISEKV